jgi:hypothetical protein
MARLVAAYRRCRPGGASGDRGDVDQVAAAVLELVEEHLGGGHRAEKVGLDHPAAVLALLGDERFRSMMPA